MGSAALPKIKELGAYYTPGTLADILAAWVVQTGREVLLEPSIGDGALLRAASSYADRRFHGQHRLRLIGIDLNHEVIADVGRWLSPTHQLHIGDFLDADPAALGTVQGVISNPPFTRNHALPVATRTRLRKRFSLKGAAGLWVPFLLHSMRFLERGGRMASVVPAAAIFTKYGREALGRICERFEHVEIRQIVDAPAWSSHADERGAIILARGYGLGSCLVPTPTSWSASGTLLVRDHQVAPPSYRQAQLSARRLEDIATISIGAVTGANRVFLLSEADRIAGGIDQEDLKLIVARGRHLKGLRVSTGELHSLAISGERTWLLAPHDIEKPRAGVRSRLAMISPNSRRKVVWLNKREPWWKVEVGPSSDAVFTYMNDVGPRIVLAVDELICTNTLHRLSFLPRVSEAERQTVALSMISSFGQLAAERIGRTYGGGLLKFELSDARSFPVLLRHAPEVKAAFEKADLAMRSGNVVGARKIADELLLPPLFGSLWESAAAEMIAEAMLMRAVRRGRSSP